MFVVGVTVNYRGSVGYGDVSIYCLPGKVWDQDVKDCQVSVNRDNNIYGTML